MHYFNFEVEGVSKLQMKFKLLDQRLRDALSKAVYRAGLIIETGAKEIITNIDWVTRGGVYRGTGKSKTYYFPGSMMIGHINTGVLKRSIQTKAGWDSFSEIIAVIGTDVPYAKYVEAHQDGGFLLPSLLKNARTAFDYLKAESKKAVESIL